ncbi:MAG: hypothetical protein ABSD27_05445 [Bryobacteraceae bacterium]|jgi:hypothetical protein
MFEASAILTYHSIDGSASAISVSPAVFERHMEWLAACGIPVVPLDRVTEVQPSLARYLLSRRLLRGLRMGVTPCAH